MLRSPRLRIAVLVAAGSLLSGCAASTAGDAPHPAHSPDHGAMSSMNGMDGRNSMDGMTMSSMKGMGPSATASMICGPEIRGAVKRTLQLGAAPRPSHTWRDMTFTCTYPVGDASLVLSVQDARAAKVGKRYFQALERRVEGATAIRGMQSLGFPAFQTHDGQVTFLKDGKTLQVDVSQVPEQVLPPGLTRTEAAYGVAAAVLACWSE